jgi:hypothetical protein
MTDQSLAPHESLEIHEILNFKTGNINTEGEGGFA